MLYKTATIIKLIWIFFIFVTVWLIGFVVFMWHINGYDYDINEHTDAIVVLTGGRNRISEGLKLYNEGKTEKLFISGVAKKTQIADLLNENDINIANTDNIYLGYMAKTTVENAAEIKQWIKENQIKSIRLITSNYHLPRSMTELSVYHLPVKIIPHPVYSEKIHEKWWLSLATFTFVFREYNKFLYAYARKLLKF